MTSVKRAVLPIITKVLGSWGFLLSLVAIWSGLLTYFLWSVYIPHPPFGAIWPYLWLGFGLILGGVSGYLALWDYWRRKQEGLPTPVSLWMKEVAALIGASALFSWMAVMTIYGAAALGAMWASSEPVSRCYEVTRPWTWPGGRAGVTSGRLREVFEAGKGHEFTFRFRHGLLAAPHVIDGDFVRVSGRESYFGMIVEKVERVGKQGCS